MTSLASCTQWWFHCTFANACHDSTASQNSRQRQLALTPRVCPRVVLFPATPLFAPDFDFNFYTLYFESTPMNCGHGARSHPPSALASDGQSRRPWVISALEHVLVLSRLSIICVCSRTSLHIEARHGRGASLCTYIQSAKASPLQSLELFSFTTLPSHIMGGSEETKKSLEDVKADLVKQLTDNARNLLKQA